VFYEFAALTCCLLTGKKDKATLSELKQKIPEKKGNAEESLKKMKQVNVTTCMIFRLLIFNPHHASFLIAGFNFVVLWLLLIFYVRS